MELKNADDRPGWAQMTTGLPMDRRPDPRLLQDFWSALRIKRSLLPNQEEGWTPLAASVF